MGIDKILGYTPDQGWTSDKTFLPIFAGFDNAHAPSSAYFILNYDVPEPATWVMMVLGVAGVGAVCAVRAGGRPLRRPETVATS